ncbi:MAG: DUF898 family protein [Burkholderiales bacterium]|nr:MAG: DUF898 family protein [Burkholderiales bacterium]
MNAPPPASRDRAPAALPPSPQARHAVRFTGTGAGLLRVWLVNLAFLLLTLGLYAPWARRRSLRWHLRHTIVAGSPLEDTGPPRWRPWDALGPVVAITVAAGLWSDRPLVEWVVMSFVAVGDSLAFAILAVAGGAAASACHMAEVRARLASVRWRGLSPVFRGRRRELQNSAWPAALLGAGCTVLAGWVLALMLQLASIDPEAHDSEVRALGLGFASALFVTLLCVPVGLVLAVWSRSRADRIAFGRIVFGREPIRFVPADLAYPIATIGAVGVLIVGLAVVQGLGVLIPPEPNVLELIPLPPERHAEAIAPLRAQADAHHAGWLCQQVARGGVVALALAWFEASLFAATWNGLRLGTAIVGRCALQPLRHARLRAMNVLLTLATLGLYLPFARVREHRAKAESVELIAFDGLESIERRLRPVD